MKNFTDILVGEDLINEAILNVKQLTFIPVELGKDSKVGKYGIAVGNSFNIKKTKYCQLIEKELQKLGLNITTGIDKAQEVINKNSTKLIYVIYNSNQVMIVNSDVLSPLDKAQKIQ